MGILDKYNSDDWDPAKKQQEGGGEGPPVGPPLQPPYNPLSGGSANTGVPVPGDSWWDVVPGASGFGKPARPGPQSWFDWFSKSYNPTPAQASAIAGDAWAYHTPSLVEAGARKLGAPLPDYLTPEAYRNYMDQARNAAGPAGPVYAAAGYLTSPLTYLGVGPASEATGAAASRLAPEAYQALASRLASGGTAAGITSGAKTAGEGGSPKDIALSAAEAIPVGALISGGVGALPFGRSTPEDVVNRTTGDVADAQAKASALKYTDKDIGFKVDANAAPSAADLREYQDWLKTVPPEQDPAGATPVLQKKINAALTQGTPSRFVPSEGGDVSVPGQPGQGAQALSAFDAATQRAQQAQRLQGWSGSVGLPGQDVRAQAAEAMQAYPPGSPQAQVLRNIASVQPADRSLPSWLRSSLSAAGAAGGELGSSLMGLHGVGSPTGAFMGSRAADLIEGLTSPKGIAPLVQQQISKAYPALTGYRVGPGGNDALSRALLYLTMGAR